jgi:hypothetical protein
VAEISGLPEKIPYGFRLTGLPDITSTTARATLALNGGTARPVFVSVNVGSTANESVKTDYLRANTPVDLMWDRSSSRWVALNITKISGEWLSSPVSTFLGGMGKDVTPPATGTYALKASTGVIGWESTHPRVVQDWDTVIEPGRYMSNGAALHSPLGGRYWFGEVVYNDGSSVHQRLYPVEGVGPECVRIHRVQAGTWSPWRLVGSPGLPPEARTTAPRPLDISGIASDTTWSPLPMTLELAPNAARYNIRVNLGVWSAMATEGWLSVAARLVANAPGASTPPEGSRLGQSPALYGIRLSGKTAQSSTVSIPMIAPKEGGRLELVAKTSVGMTGFIQYAGILMTPESWVLGSASQGAPLPAPGEVGTLPALPPTDGAPGDGESKPPEPGPLEARKPRKK